MEPSSREIINCQARSVGRTRYGRFRGSRLLNDDLARTGGTGTVMRQALRAAVACVSLLGAASLPVTALPVAAATAAACSPTASPAAVPPDHPFLSYPPTQPSRPLPHDPPPPPHTL